MNFGISETTRSKIAELCEKHKIRWRAIIGFRNIVVHDYFSLDVDILYRTSKEFVKVLTSDVARIIAIEYPEFSNSDK